jgi:hypothetical protein
VDKVALGQVFYQSTSVFFLSVSFQQFYVHIFIYVLLLPDGGTADNWEASKKQFSFGNRGALVEKVLSLGFQV